MPCGVFKEDYMSDMGLLRYPVHWVAAALGLAAALTAPLVHPGVLVYAVTVVIFSVAALGLNILMGYAGQISLAQGALMGIGAYAAAYAAHYTGEAVSSILVGGLAAALVSLVAGLPSFRLKEYYLAMASIAAQFVLHWLLRVVLTPSRGFLEVPRASILGITGISDESMYYLSLAVLVLLLVAAANVTRSQAGRAMMAVRDNDVAAELSGINTSKAKAQAFMLSAFYAGVAGGLWAFYQGALDPSSSFDLSWSIMILAMVLVGGLGRHWGAVIGAAIVGELGVLVDELVSGMMTPGLQAGLREIVFGSLIVAIMIMEPGGFIDVLRRIKEYFRLWPFSY